MLGAKIFSPSGCCFVALLIVYFAVQKLLSLTCSHLFILALTASASVTFLRSDCLGLPMQNSVIIAGSFSSIFLYSMNADMLDVKMRGFFFLPKDDVTSNQITVAL